MKALARPAPLRKVLNVTLALLLAFGWLWTASGCQPDRAFAAARQGQTGYVSYIGDVQEDTRNKNPSGTPALSNRIEITVDGVAMLAICAEHENGTPAHGAAVTNVGVVSNSDIRRILYYGYGGPADQGYSVVRTATAVSLANGHMETSLAQSMIDAVRQLPAPPDNWMVEMWSTGSSGIQNLVTGRLVRYTGWIDLQKHSTDESITASNACYALEGAVYGVYASETDAQAKRAAVDTLMTDAQGYAKSQKLDVGRYYVRETAAPAGMRLDDTVYAVDVAKDATARVNAESGGTVQDEPFFRTIDVLLTKGDAQRPLESAQPQGGATLARSLWTVRFYDGHFTSAEAAEKSGEPLRTWMFSTDAQGRVLLDSAYLEEGSDSLWTVDDQAVLPLGTLVMEETAAPEGYLNTAEDNARTAGIPYPFLRLVTADGAYDAPAAADDVVRGGVRVHKTDRETGSHDALGAAALDGTTFSIVSLNENPVLVDGVLYEKDQTVKTIVVEDGWAQTSNDALPYGSYAIRELSAGTGYLVSEDVRTFAITNEGEMVEIDGKASMTNQVVRGDLQLLKTGGNDDRPLAGVAFRITSDTTGESHVIVTNEEGTASTATAHAPHTQDTNANDAVRDGAYLPHAGVWFGQTVGGSSAGANDSLGALPYDTYTIEELPCTGNEGYQLVDPLKVTASQHDIVVDLGAVNNPQGQASTQAADAADGDRIIVANGNATLADTVSYANLVPLREYHVHGVLVDQATGEPLMQEGAPIESLLSFTPEEAHGSVRMEYVFDAFALGNRTIMPFVEITCDNRLVAEHKDLADAAQMVQVVQPALATTATDASLKSKVVPCDPYATVVDTVSFSHLTPGETYRLEGALALKETGELLEEGNVSLTFVPDTAEGRVRMEFPLDSSTLAGKDIVVMEWLYAGERAIAAHADAADEEQTVTVATPSLTTQARDARDGDKAVSAEPRARVTDTVVYDNLVPGAEYVVTGTLVQKDTGAAVTANGKPVTSSVAFTPEQTQGSVEVTFDFDGTDYADQEVVVTEQLERAGTVLVHHDSLDNADQTVLVSQPRLSTSAADKADGDALVLAERGSAVVDTVDYEGLNPGREYELFGELYLKKTGEPLMIGGKAVTGCTSFVPESPNGTVEVTFAFDASDLAGETLVAVETLRAEGVVVAAHADLEDANQTVGVVLPPQPEPYDKTGVRELLPLAAALAVVCTAGAGAMAYGLHRGRTRCAESARG